MRAFKELDLDAFYYIWQKIRRVGEFVEKDG